MNDLQDKPKLAIYVAPFMVAIFIGWLCFQGQVYQLTSPSGAAKAIFVSTPEETYLYLSDPVRHRIVEPVPVDNRELPSFDEAFWSKDGSVLVIRSFKDEKEDFPASNYAYDFENGNEISSESWLSTEPRGRKGQQLKINNLVLSRGGRSETKVSADELEKGSRHLWPWELAYLW